MAERETSILRTFTVPERRRKCRKTSSSMSSLDPETSGKDLELNRNEIVSDAIPFHKVTVRNYYYKPKCFSHFQYISNLARNCEVGIRKVTKSNDFETALRTDVMIKITFVGEITEEELKYVSKRKGKDRMSTNKVLWEASPVVCFQKDKNQELALEYMNSVKACHKILVICTSVPKATADKNNNIIFADVESVGQELVSCLEDPIRSLLDKWTQMIKTASPNKTIFWVTKEIENIRKHMLFEETKDATAPESPSPEYAHIVPENVKKYLFSHNDVTSFGLWHNSRFKIFVEKKTDMKKIKKELRRLDQMFFEKFRIHFENGKLVKKLTMKQGDFILGKKSENIFEGTLGGFVKETRRPGKIYALTCNHVFPEKSYTAYADKELHSEIGRCVFTTREKSTDFAVIEMNKSVVCDDIFRKDDQKKTIACVFDGNINNIGFVHKIGAKSGPTTGFIVSSEYYEKLYDDDNREFIFLVGGREVFSEDGDSGALVFSRPLDVRQTYVNVIGMVYGTYQKEDERFDDEENASGGMYTLRKTINIDDKSQDNTSTIYERKEQFNLDVSTDPDYISCCYRIRPALDLFQENQHVSVKFRDDLPSSASSSSSEDSCSENC